MLDYKDFFIVCYKDLLCLAKIVCNSASSLSTWTITSVFSIQSYAISPQFFLMYNLSGVLTILLLLNYFLKSYWLMAANCSFLLYKYSFYCSLYLYLTDIDWDFLRKGIFCKIKMIYILFWKHIESFSFIILSQVWRVACVVALQFSKLPRIDTSSCEQYQVSLYRSKCICI